MGKKKMLLLGDEAIAKAGIDAGMEWKPLLWNGLSRTRTFNLCLNARWFRASRFYGSSSEKTSVVPLFTQLKTASFEAVFISN